MYLGCNLSTQLMELIDEKQVEVDYVKIAIKEPSEFISDELKQYGRLMLHGIGIDIPQHLGAKYQYQDIPWDVINRQIDFCESPHLAIHCATFWKDWENGVVTYQAIKKRMTESIQIWKSHIKVPFLIENVPYSSYYEKNAPGTIKECVNPQLIRELCHENEIGLCLDLAHAKVAAWGLGISFKDYLSELPLDCVKELHIVGTRMVDGNMRDNHIEMIEEDYEVLDWLLDGDYGDSIRKGYLTLEYGGFGEHFAWRSDKDAIKRQLLRISKYRSL